MSILQAKHHINTSRVTPIIQDDAFKRLETPWRKYYQAKCQYCFAFKTCHIKCYAGCNYFTFKRIGEFFFKNSEARGKNTLHLIDDTTKKSGTKTFDAKSVMITNAVQGDPRKD